MEKKSTKKKKTNKDEVAGEVTAYIIEERTASLIFTMQYDNIPDKNDHIVIVNENIIYEFNVQNRTFIINTDDNTISWNLYVVQIGTPREIQVQEKSEDKNDEILN